MPAAGNSAAATVPDAFANKLFPGDTRPSARGPGIVAVERADVEMSLPASSDEEGDEDEFDEDDFAASEQKYLLERNLIEAKKPPPLLQDHVIRTLLIRIQFLNMILHNVIPKPKDEDTIMEDTVKPTQLPQIGLPSPDQMSEEQEEKPELRHPQPRGRPLSQAPVNPIPTPPLEDLPYLRKEAKGHATFEDSDDEVQQEAITTLIRQEFERCCIRVAE